MIQADLSGILFQNFCAAYRKADSKLPYSINILDELHGNENFHSRFLIKIWSLRIGDEYPVLRHFLDYLKSPFSELKIEKPWLSAESDRIDARIRCAHFSIIVENKIHGAVEQPNQVDRYIQNERAAGLADNDIYVLYLTRSGGSPSAESLSEQYRKDLGNRIRDISFRSDILPWLNLLSEKLIPGLDANVTQQLKVAILQYTDHLHGLFFEREGDKIMRSEMLNFLGTELQLSDSQKASQNVRAINEAREMAAKLQIYLQELEDETIFSALNTFQNSLAQLSHPELNPMIPEKPFGEKYSSLMWHPKKWKSHFAIGFSFDERFNKLYYGIRDYSTDDQSAATNTDLQKKLSELFPHNDPNAAWPLGIWRRTYRIDSEFISSIEDGNLMTEFRQIISDIVERAKQLAELHAA